MQEGYLHNKQILQKKISEIIKRHRINKKKSISLISDEINMTKSMWADLEKSIKDPQLSTLWRIAEGLEIPLSSLIKELEGTLDKDFTLTDNN